MKVRLKVAISGTRNGVEWPTRGGVVDLPASEAVDLINGGLAEPVKLEDAVETASAPSGDVETAEKPVRHRRK